MSNLYLPPPPYFVPQIDIFLSFRTAYVYHGTLVTKPDKIAWKYIKKGYFFIDLIACLPLEMFFYEDEGNAKSLSSYNKTIKMAKLIKVTRLLR